MFVHKYVKKKKKARKAKAITIQQRERGTKQRTKRDRRWSTYIIWAPRSLARPSKPGQRHVSGYATIWGAKLVAATDDGAAGERGSWKDKARQGEARESVARGKGEEDVGRRPSRATTSSTAFKRQACRAGEREVKKGGGEYP